MLQRSDWYSIFLDGCTLRRNCNKSSSPPTPTYPSTPLQPIVLLSMRGGGPLRETDTNFSDMEPVICVIPLEHSQRTCRIPTDQQRQGGWGLGVDRPSFLLLGVPPFFPYPAIPCPHSVIFPSPHQCYVICNVGGYEAATANPLAMFFCLQIFMFVAINIQIRSFLGSQQALELILE